MECLSPTQMTASGVTLDIEGVSFDLSPGKPFVLTGVEERVGSDLD